MQGRWPEFWELRGWQRVAFLSVVVVVAVYALWMGAFSDGGGIGCRLVRQHWHEYGEVPAEVQTDAERPQDVRAFGVSCRPAAAHVAPDCAVRWTVDGRIRMRRCGPVDQSSIEDWL